MTFVIFYWLEASHKSCLHSRGRDYTKVWTPGDRGHGVTLQSATQI